MSQGAKSNNQEFAKNKQQDAVRRLFSHVLQYKKWLAVAMVAMVVTAGSSSLIALLVGQLTDKGFYEKDPTAIWWAPGSLLIISLAYGVSSFVSSYFLQRISQDILHKFRTNSSREYYVGRPVHTRSVTRVWWCLYLSIKPVRLSGLPRS